MSGFGNTLFLAKASHFSGKNGFPLGSARGMGGRPLCSEQTCWNPLGVLARLHTGEEDAESRRLVLMQSRCGW